jgi:hypothetical protein
MLWIGIAWLVLGVAWFVRDRMSDTWDGSRIIGAGFLIIGLAQVTLALTPF